MADTKNTTIASGEKSLLDESQKPGAHDDARTQPRDSLRLVYLVFLLHGVGVMLPWNSFINARDYFVNFKLDTETSADADYRVNFMNYLGLAAQLPNLLLAGFNVFFQSTRPTVQSGSSIPKLMFVIAIEIAVCVFTCALAIADSASWPRLFFDLTILSVVILLCCTGVYQSSAYGMAALLPMAYSNAVVLGNNLCGTVIAVANILCKLASAKNLQLTAISYFAFSTLLLIFCFASLIALPKLRFFRHFQAKMIEIPMAEAEQSAAVYKAMPAYIDDDMENRADSPVMEAQPSDGRGDNSGAGCELVTVVPATAADESLKLRVREQYTDTAKECFACIGGSETLPIARRYWLRYWLALKDGWVHCLSVWSVFFCTLACFPAVQSAVVPTTLDKVWFADIYVFLFFNLFAMVGNIVSNFIQLPSPRWLAHFVWCRTIFFIPFFLMCNCLPDRRSPSFPVLIHSDAAFILGMILFGFTSGYFSSLCMMYAPRSVKRQEHASLVAMLATFFLVLGVCCGIAFGAILTNTIQIGWTPPDASAAAAGLGLNATAPIESGFDNVTATLPAIMDSISATVSSISSTVASVGSTVANVGSTVASGNATGF